MPRKSTKVTKENLAGAMQAVAQAEDDWRIARDYMELKRERLVALTKRASAQTVKAVMETELGREP